MTEDQAQIRSFQPELEVRTKGSQREIEGIAVPYNQPQRITHDLIEQFDPGSSRHQFGALHRVKAAYEHIPLGGKVVGNTIHMEDTSDGLFWRARISKTPAGDEMLELVKDKVLTHLSVGFRSRGRRQIRATSGEFAGETIVARTKVDLFEVAVTLEGAYGELATIGGVRTIRRLDADSREEHGEEDVDTTEDFEVSEARRAEQLAFWEDFDNGLAARMSKLTEGVVLRGAIPPHTTGTVDREWNQARSVAAAPDRAEVLNYMAAWADPTGEANVRSTYKFFHHEPVIGSPANLRACAELLAKLSTANIPDADKVEVERHLKRHLEDGR